MLKRCSWLLSALFLLVLNATSAHAGAWSTTHPELCTPDGYSTPVMCTPIKTDDWQFFDFSGIPYSGVQPGYYPSGLPNGVANCTCILMIVKRVS